MARHNLGVGFTGAPYTVKEVVQLAQLAEREGYSSFWYAEDYYMREAISNMACVAYATKKIEISTGIINPFTRNPVLIAETIATLNELATRRVKLALGTGVKPLIEGMGIEFKRPLLAMKESIEIIRRLLKGERLDYAGEIFSAKGVKVGENPYFGLIKGSLKAVPVPIYLAAIGPKMLELGGRIADGVLFTAGFAVENVRQAIPLVEKGVRASGRSTRDVAIGCYIVVGLGRPNNAIKGFLAFDVAFARPENVVAAGFAESRVLEIKNAMEKKGLTGAAELVTRDIVDKFAACGSKGEIQAKVEEFRAAGVTDPVLLPMGADAAKLIRSIS
jgi:5,10-methylenetetrahydromethanopterin reductase